MRTKQLREILKSWDAGAWGEPASSASGVSVLRSTNIRRDGSLSYNNQAVLEIDEKVVEKKQLEHGDILLERSGGGPKQPVGRVAIFSQPIDSVNGKYICGNFISRLVPNRKIIDPEFLFYVLLHWHWSGETEKFQTATTGIRNLQIKQYLDKELIVPEDVKKQRQISARLKAQLAEVDKARQAAEVQLRDATALKAKALEAILGRVSNKQPIGSAAKLQSGYAFKSESFRTNGIRLLRNANILPGKVYWDEAVFLSENDAEKYPSYVLNDGDVLISLDRPIISSGIKVARVWSDDLPALLVQRVGRFILDPKKLDADYLYAYLQTEMFIAEITGHDQSLGVPHISPTQVESIEIPMPDVNIQRALSGQLKDALREWQTAVSAIKSQKNDLSILPQSILAQAFEM